MALQKKDWLFAGLVILVLGIFFAISGEETTTHVPNDDLHAKFFSVYQQDGKKAAEKFCGECHKADGVPFPENHPPKFRCLFCHKFAQ